MSAQRVVLIGFSGVGKSSVGRLAAERLGWRLNDTDIEIEKAFGTSIPEIFRLHGETVFRAQERSELVAALSQSKVVIACGAGAAVDPAVWTSDFLGASDTLVVALDAEADTSLERLISQQHAEGEAVERPMLAAANPLERITSLKAQRQASYDAADITIATDRVAADVVADEIAWLATLGQEKRQPSITLEAASGTSAIYVEPGRARALGALIHERWPKAQRAWIITDRIVERLHGPAVVDDIASAGLLVRMIAVPEGEASKSLAEASRLYDWLLDGGIERGDVIVALGGGVVGDLAGFVAATTLRGVGLVQVPTTLLSMVDSSVGGKTGIDHRSGKNLIGAFYQPPIVVIDPTLLDTLPTRQVINGWAEIVKHAVIQASTPNGSRRDLMTFLERNQRSLAAGSLPAVSYLVRRNVELKAAVVAADEREAGIRAYLNFGHTLGHAIEAAGYRMLHGEAVAVGMRAEARIGLAMESCTPATASAIEAALDRIGLPESTSAEPEAVLQFLGSDKKRLSGKLRWVLPHSAGGVTMRDDVPLPVVRESLQAVTKFQE